MSDSDGETDSVFGTEEFNKKTHYKTLVTLKALDLGTSCMFFFLF